MVTADEPPADALGRLQWSWGSAYGITGAWAHWWRVGATAAGF
jgi:hypothetical protein